MPIIFFDGICGLCNKTVDVLIRADKKQIFMFAPIQGSTAAGLISEIVQSTHGETIILLHNSKVYTHSDAVLQICRQLDGAWRLVTIAGIIPRFIRDRIYQFISRNRYRWFGKNAVCRIPTERERSRFLP